MYIANGPYGLRAIGTYEKTVTLPLAVGAQARQTTARAVIFVDDAHGFRVADAVCNTDNPEIEEAKQWLLDFALVSAGGQ